MNEEKTVVIRKQYPKIIPLIALFLVPGLIISTTYAFLASPIVDMEFPAIGILALAGVLTLIPVELGIILYRSKKDFGILSLKKMLPYQNELSIKTYLWLVPLLLLWAIMIMVFGSGINEYIRNEFFFWVPDWYVISADYSGYDTWKVVITLISLFLFGGLIFPIIEEIYFRGYLLPRMEWMGKWAPIVNAFLFSLYHFWTPWQTITRTVALIPFCYIAYRTKNIKITIVAHCLLNIMGDVVGVLIVLL